MEVQLVENVTLLNLCQLITTYPTYNSIIDEVPTCVFVGKELKDKISLKEWRNESVKPEYSGSCLAVLAAGTNNDTYYLVAEKVESTDVRQVLAKLWEESKEENKFAGFLTKLMILFESMTPNNKNDVMKQVYYIKKPVGKSDKDGLTIPKGALLARFGKAANPSKNLEFGTEAFYRMVLQETTALVKGHPLLELETFILDSFLKTRMPICFQNIGKHPLLKTCEGRKTFIKEAIDAIKIKKGFHIIGPELYKRMKTNYAAVGMTRFLNSSWETRVVQLDEKEKQGNIWLKYDMGTDGPWTKFMRKVVHGYWSSTGNFVWKRHNDVLEFCKMLRNLVAHYNVPDVIMEQLFLFYPGLLSFLFLILLEYNFKIQW